jgi:hypothetical protein
MLVRRTQSETSIGSASSEMEQEQKATIQLAPNARWMAADNGPCACSNSNAGLILNQTG